MKIGLAVIVLMLLLALSIWMIQGDDAQEVNSGVPASKKRPEPTKNSEEQRDPSANELLEKGMVEDSGEAHEVALEYIVRCLRDRVVLNPADRDALLGFISQSKPADIGTGQWQERVNEILNLLRAQPDGVPGLAELLVQMSADDPDPVLRMYALQHLSVWIPKETDEVSKSMMVERLEELAENGDDPLAGSAVLFLSDLERVQELPDRIDSTEVIENTALRLVGDSNARPDVRICALHASAERKLPGVIKDSRAIADDPSLMITLRKAAIYTIGEVGSTDDIALLESISKSNHVLTAATKPAIKRIRLRSQNL